MKKKFITLLLGTLMIGLPCVALGQNLSAIYALAVENDPQLKQMDIKQEISDEINVQSRAKFFPSVSISGMGSKVFENNTNNGSAIRAAPYQAYFDTMIGVNVTQPLFHWEYWISLDQSEHKMAQAEAEYQAELQNLMLRTATAYFNILAAQDNLNFVMIEKQAVTQQLEQVKQRFSAGIIAITDVYEAQASYDQSIANEIAALNEVSNRKESLKEIIGDIPHPLHALRERLPLVKPRPEKLQSWLDVAETGNFNIIAAISHTEAAHKAIELQRGGHLPQVDLVGSYAVLNNTGLYGFQGNSSAIGVRLNLPLYEGGAVNSRTRQAHYELDAAKEQLTALKRLINHQVTDAYNGIMTNISQITALETTVKSVKNALLATQASFEAGTRTMADILLKQKNLYQVQRDLSRARYDYLLNSLKLKQLTGNLTPHDLRHIDTLLHPPTASYMHNQQQSRRLFP